MKTLSIHLFLLTVGFWFALANATGALAQGRKAKPNGHPSHHPAIGEETTEGGEEEMIEAIKQATIEIIKKEYPPSVRPVRRDAHPKTFGVVKAEFIVLDDLPEELQYGVFETPRKYDALIRFSAGGTSVKADTEKEPRGMAIKLLGVEGEKILESERNEKTQDFVMINFPGFAVTNLRDYKDFFEASAKSEEARTEFLQKHPDMAERIKEMDEQPLENPLQAQYWSEVPYKLGPGAMKFSARAVSKRGEVIEKGPDYLREALLAQLKQEDVYFDFLVQLQRNPKKMPIENPMIIWSDKLSPFQRVAIIRIPKQDPTRFKDLDLAELLSFTPWHALPEQRPLGSINRARKPIYEALSILRHKMNDLPRQEPTELPPEG